MRSLWVMAAVSLASVGFAQSDGFKKPSAKAPAVVSSGPVTQAEARQVFERYQKLFGKVLKRPANASTLRASSQPVTRAQVVAEMNRLFEWARPSFKFTPNTVAVRRDVIKIPQAQRPGLEKLIVWGAVAPFGPLATGPRDTMTIREFGDSLGFFITRMADLTHTPSSQFTPALMDDR